ncbi:hypothetical protein AB0N17_07350 [Streptomyces sp. NPDC051133]|uniref:hypothetical protein n=1 Tax=Streptomyces sp. NPDC051133 TaxID=3155521 RepID=UPI0034458945
MYDDLTAACVRGGDHGKAAAATFRSIPSFLEQGRLPEKNFSLAKSADHRAGYDAQIAALREEFPKLLT